MKTIYFQYFSEILYILFCHLECADNCLNHAEYKGET